MKILLAIDNSEASEKAIQFTATLCRGKDDAQIIVYHVFPENGDAAAAEQLAAAAQQSLTSAGVAAGQVETRPVPRECDPETLDTVAALSIIEEMAAGTYNVVCVGRRSVKSAQGTFTGSVAEKVLEESRGRTVCVVD